MARISRIPHPPGSTFFRLHAWAIQAVGRDAAIVLDAIDFLDMREELAGQPVVSRLKLLAHLEGVIGRNSVDKALKLLVDSGWVKKTEKVHLNQSTSNINTFHLYSLHPEKISRFLEGDSRDPGLGTPGIPNPEQNPGQDPEPRQNPGAAPELNPCPELRQGASKEIEETKEEAEEKKPASASAINPMDQKPAAIAKHSIFNVRDSGIATWNTDDEEKASRIEATYAPDRILAAVTKLNKQNKLPLPGYVRMALLQVDSGARQDDAMERLSGFENKTVRIVGLESPVHVRRRSNGFYGELLKAKGGLAHSQLVDLVSQGLISLSPVELHQLPAK